MKQLCLTLIIVTSITATGFCETVLTLTTDPFPPYIIKNDHDDNFHGVFIDYLDDIFNEITTIRIKTIYRPWARCLKEAEMGTVDGVLMLFKTPERESYLEVLLGSLLGSIVGVKS